MSSTFRLIYLVQQVVIKIIFKYKRKYHGACVLPASAYALYLVTIKVSILIAAAECGVIIHPRMAQLER